MLGEGGGLGIGDVESPVAAPGFMMEGGERRVRGDLGTVGAIVWVCEGVSTVLSVTVEGRDIGEGS